MHRISGIFVLCLGAISACTQAQQPPTHDTTAAGEIADAKLLDRPITVLDYALLRIHDELTNDAPFIKEMHLWRAWVVSGMEMPTEVTAIALAPDSAHVIVGYDVSTGSLTQRAREVCRTIDGFASRSTAADSGTRRIRWARDNVLSRFMPRATAASVTAEVRSRANDDLQRRMSVVITIYERSTRRFTKCERQALSDSMTVEEQTAGGKDE